MTIALHNVLFFLAVLASWLIVGKPLFLALNGKGLTARNVASVYRHGFKSDLTASAYVTAPVLLLSFFGGASPLLVGVLSFLMALAIVADAVLYVFWQSKIDASVFAYLRTPKGALASVSVGYLIVVLLGLCAVWAVVWGILLLPCHATLAVSTSPLVTYGASLLCAALLFVFWRGWGKRPITPSVAYFSQCPLLNHAAVNPLHNVMYSLSVGNEYRNRYRFLSEEQRASVMETLYPYHKGASTPLIAPRPNVLIIFWESLNAHYLHEDGVLPNLRRIATEGIHFTNYHASSFRTDRGLPAVLCALPGQPLASVVRYPRKLPKLPSIVRVLRERGYATTAVHGGDCQIMHKNDFYLATGHERLLQQRDFPRPQRREDVCKWGIHDGVMFEHILSLVSNLNATGKPWELTFQTLSSHEDFRVPYHRLTDKAKNAFAYTDDAFGKFYDDLKRSPAWGNTLIVLTGDHGFNDGKPREEYPHIPLLLLGGAVRTPREVDTLMCQTDVAATLLAQMGLPHDDFPFSRNVLSPLYTRPFALHAYNNGWLMRTPEGFTHVDGVTARAIAGAHEERELWAKAILQTVHAYLAEL